MVQRLKPAVSTIELDRAIDGMIMSRLDKFGTQYDRWAKGNKRDARSTWKIFVGLASTMGQKMKYNVAEDVFNDIAKNIKEFHSLDYDVVGEKGAKLNLPVAEKV